MTKWLLAKLNASYMTRQIQFVIFTNHKWNKILQLKGKWVISKNWSALLNTLTRIFEILLEMATLQRVVEQIMRQHNFSTIFIIFTTRAGNIAEANNIFVFTEIQIVVMANTFHKMLAVYAQLSFMVIW